MKQNQPRAITKSEYPHSEERKRKRSRGISPDKGPAEARGGRRDCKRLKYEYKLMNLLCIKVAGSLKEAANKQRSKAVAQLLSKLWQFCIKQLLKWQLVTVQKVCLWWDAHSNDELHLAVQGDGFPSLHGLSPSRREMPLGTSSSPPHCCLPREREANALCFACSSSGKLSLKSFAQHGLHSANNSGALINSTDFTSANCLKRNKI